MLWKIFVSLNRKEAKNSDEILGSLFLLDQNKSLINLLGIIYDECIDNIITADYISGINWINRKVGI